MINLTINSVENIKEFPKLKKELKEAFIIIQKVLKNQYLKYDLTPLNKIKIILKKDGGKTFYHDHIINRHIVLSIIKNKVIFFYPRKKSKYLTPIKGLLLTPKQYFESVLIHEYTHAVQELILKTNFSEIETTNNQIYHLKIYYPNLFKKLKKIKKNKYKRGDIVSAKKWRIKEGKILKTKILHYGRHYDINTYKFYNKFYDIKNYPREIIKNVPEKEIKKLKKDY